MQKNYNLIIISWKKNQHKRTYAYWLRTSLLRIYLMEEDNLLAKYPIQAGLYSNAPLRSLIKES